MSETESLLKNAADLAKRTFIDPSEASVMEIFKELCAERDRRAWDGSDANGATVH